MKVRQGQRAPAVAPRDRRQAVRSADQPPSADIQAGHTWTQDRIAAAWPAFEYLLRRP
jgi:hypothetical protein